jgi:hypothetical protein
MLDHRKFGEREGGHMADTGLILVIGATDQLGAVRRALSGLLFQSGYPVPVTIRREADGAAALPPTPTCRSETY